MRVYIRFFWGNPAWRVAVLAGCAAFVIGCIAVLQGNSILSWASLILGVVGLGASLVFFLQSRSSRKTSQKEQS